MSSPKINAASVRLAREKAGLTLKESAETVGVTLRSWQRYESGERQISYAVYELFLIKTGQNLAKK